jgi:quercetin dioxygenase-like cupin family protein/DNA-binding Xre family transcriptional regulator
MTIYRQMDIELSYFSQNLVKLRKLRGLSQQQLSNLAEIPRSTISSLESGQGNATLANVLRISKSLQISIDELLNKPTNDIQLVKLKDIKVKRKTSTFTLFNLLPHPVDHIELERIEIEQSGYMGGVPHSKNTKEYFVCLKGTAEITVEGEKFILKKGDSLFFPGDCRHSYRNPMREPLHGISVIVRK